MHPFLTSLLGGVLIGVSASLLLLFNGRIAGISGIAGGLLGPLRPGETAWRLAFVLGLVVGGALLTWGLPSMVGGGGPSSPWVLIAGGLLVGFGTRLGSGCTSGHGVCGLARGSARSLVATATFMSTAALTVFVVRHVLSGGA